ncbi:hypothetical protein [Mycolicibacterium sediminis]|uniref:Uncharacterized protein n=1 Tax=Mycolicibacterium sediminis TaxID=1286180 RepID=A0A7I7QMJ6_9MYCO|nr:hypothetical protein [Mycolicibacterium sediminis]BBY27504.1 hypothetical protein MSEDJ_16000 [Mycolicibacterium sediminis]
MSTPDHVENTGENLRRAAEVTGATDADETVVADEAPETPLPDFNT